MSAPAPPAERPSATSRRAAARRGFLGGLGAFGIVAAICIAIGMIEYAGSGGRYHAWTWVKVGFLYLLSSCDVAVRVRAIGAGTNLQLLYRVPLLAGTTLILWLIVRATRRALGEDPAKGVSVAGGAAAALGFAVPGVLVALPANLRFPSSLPFELFVSPVRWQAAVLVPAVSAAGAATGVFLARRHRPTARSEAGALAAAWLGGGAWMFASALLLGLVGFLVTAALRPTQTRAYVQDAQGWGRGGVVAVTHHILLIPDQSIWLLAPSMGGVTHLRVDLGDQPLGRLSITLREITLGGKRSAPMPDRFPDTFRWTPRPGCSCWSRRSPRSWGVARRRERERVAANGWSSGWAPGSCSRYS